MGVQLKEWRERWNQGDTKFVPELFEKIELYEKALKEIESYSSSPYNGRSAIKMKIVARKALESYWKVN